MVPMGMGMWASGVLPHKPADATVSFQSNESVPGRRRPGMTAPESPVRTNQLSAHPRRGTLAVSEPGSSPPIMKSSNSFIHNGICLIFQGRERVASHFLFSIKIKLTLVALHVPRPSSCAGGEWECEWALGDRPHIVHTAVALGKHGLLGHPSSQRLHSTLRLSERPLS